jgi:hypothetical protein
MSIKHPGQMPIQDPVLPPTHPQHSIRVAGWALPDRDFHPARDAKLGALAILKNNDLLTTPHPESAKSFGNCYKPASHLLLFEICQSLEQWRGRMNRDDQMKAAWTLLQEVELDKARGGRKQVRETARHVSVSLPAHVVRRLDNLENARSRHVERAVKLYLLLLERFLPNPRNE